jgi:hypothetical protein
MVMPTESTWASRFIWAAIVQGALTAVLSFLLLLGEVNVLPVRVSLLVSTTVPGIWIALGYVAYVLIGAMGMAVTALFYHYLEVNLKKPYTGMRIWLARLHLILSNVGIAGTSWLVMYVGYLTGIATLSKSFGGLGLPLEQVEVSTVGSFLAPIVFFALLTILGIFVGGVGYVLVYRSKPRRSS